MSGIENILNKPIQRLDISKNEYKDRLDFSDTKSSDWQSLIMEAEADENRKPKIPAKKKKKSKKKKKKSKK